METDTKMSVSVLDHFFCAGVIMTFLPSQIKATLEEGTYSCFNFQCSLQFGAVSWQQRVYCYSFVFQIQWESHHLLLNGTV